MAGRIRDEDVAHVRQRSPLPDIVGEHLALRPAGGGQLKGLCPFHEEKTASFLVSPTRGLFHCFGCGASGDVITFVQRLEHLSFAEAVEWLAARAGVALRYEQGGAAPRQQQGQRIRLVAAHAAAAEFYAEQLRGAPAAEARRFLRERGFDEAAAERFGCGYAPDSWDALVRHLRGRGFTDPELLAGGLVREGRRGLVDRFVGRLLWPVRDITGDVIGFGARRLREDDPAPKYLNTPETPIYKKSHVLFGLDLAKKEIARRMQAVVVEGYTDVMACHLAGVPTAVGTCGTAFGVEHIRILRRLLMDQDEFRGEVVFTFDGDAAGRQAALRAFTAEQQFVTSTFVAVEPHGLDPCELRCKAGDAAVRELVASRVPLFEFAIRSVLDRYDLEIPEGRVRALAAAAPVVAQIKDRSLRPEYARRLAGWLGMEVEAVFARVGESAGSPARPPRAHPPAPSAARPDPRDPSRWVEREVLKLAVQRPVLAGPVFDALPADVFTHPAYAAVRDVIMAAGGAAAGGDDAWVARLRERAGDDAARALVTELAVEPLRSSTGEADERYVAALLARVQELATTRRIADLKSRLQRLNPLEHAEECHRLFGELVALEQHRRGLREQAIGAL